MAVGFERGPFFGGLVAEEIARGFFEERQLFCVDGIVVDVAGAPGKALEAVVIEPVVVGQELEGDEKRIAGEGGERGVRGVAIAGGAEGKDLPEALPGGGEEVGEVVGGGAEVADATERRQRRNVQQQA